MSLCFSLTLYDQSDILSDFIFFNYTAHPILYYIIGLSKIESNLQDIVLSYAITPILFIF